MRLLVGMPNDPHGTYQWYLSGRPDLTPVAVATRALCMETFTPGATLEAGISDQGHGEVALVRLRSVLTRPYRGRIFAAGCVTL